MNQTRSNLLLALATIVPTVGLMLAWMADQWFTDTPWFSHLNMLTIALVIAGVYGAHVLGDLVRTQWAARRYLDLFSHLDALDLRSFDLDRVADELPPSSVWYASVRRHRDLLLKLHDRLEEVEMKQASLEVRSRRNAKEHRQVTAILENLSDPILVVDEYDELVLANSSASELFDFQLEPDEKRLLSDLIACENIVRLLAEAQRRKTSTERSCELELANRHGETRWYRVTARNFASMQGQSAGGGNGSGQGAVAMLRDISTHKEIQKRNAEFVSSVSHEMKTPLAGIKAYLELLVDGDAEDEETQLEFLDIIGLQADRLQRLVENLLNIARIEAGVVNVSKAEQSLNELLEEAFGIIQPQAEAKQINLVKELSPMYLGVYVDRDMMMQAAINLLSNAVKYTPEGGKVALRSRLIGNSVEFEVEDEGVGLSEEDQQRVFEKFYRVGKDKSMASGTGLGLPLARHIVEDVHQGRLVVKSKLDQGSTFSVRIPPTGRLNT